MKNIDWVKAVTWFFIFWITYLIWYFVIQLAVKLTM